MKRDLIPWRSILLSDKGRICLAEHADVAYEKLSFYERNHNLFRLDAEFNVVWQVRRDERGALDLEAGLASAIANGTEGFYVSHEPFMSLAIVYADGTTNYSNKTFSYPDVDIWLPGCTIHATSISGHGYTIDIDTGVATNYTGRGRRAW